METQNISNLLKSSKNEFSKFATKNGTLFALNERVIIHTKSNKVFDKVIRIRSLSLF